MTNDVQFSLELKRFARKLVPGAYRQFVDKLALDMLRSIVLNTRVDTGRLRGNWQVETTSNGNESEVGGLGHADPIGAGASALSVERDTFSPVTIFNNVPYAPHREVEDGMISEALLAAQIVTRSAVL